MDATCSNDNADEQPRQTTAIVQAARALLSVSLSIYLHHKSPAVATIDMGRKKGRAAVPLSRGGAAGSPSNTMCPGPRST